MGERRNHAQDGEQSSVQPPSGSRRGVGGNAKAAAVLRMQRQAGNRATGQALWGRGPVDRPAAPTPFGDSQRVVQRRYSAGYKDTAVDFDVTAYAPAMGKPAQIIKDASSLEITSQDYTMDATVAGTGAKNVKGDFALANYQLGVVQTVYESNRHYYYVGDKQRPGKGAKKITDTCTTQPVRDGDTGVVPWYEVGDVADFGPAAASTKSTDIYDRPGTAQPWKKDFGGGDQFLIKTSGKDVFRTWVAVHNKKTKKTTWMDYNDWSFDYGTAVTVDKKNLASSTVTPTTAGGKTGGHTKGPGAKAPLLGDPVANDVAADVITAW